MSRESFIASDNPHIWIVSNSSDPLTVSSNDCPFFYLDKGKLRYKIPDPEEFKRQMAVIYASEGV